MEGREAELQNVASAGGADSSYMAIGRLLGNGAGEATVQLALQSLSRRDQRVAAFLRNPCLPAEGWEDEFVEAVVVRLAAMDSNSNGTCGVGEREGRVYSSLVRRRHWGFAHGIGRSGDLVEVQPKALGSSLLQIMTNKLTKQALKVAGMHIKAWECAVVPMATGMTLSLVLRAVASQRPASRFVLMPRIDQKSCIKCVASAGLQLVIIENRIEGDALVTNVEAISAKIEELGCDRVAAVLTTSSCFAPRGCDALLAVGRLCHPRGIPHIVNNAYGVQSRLAVTNINKALREEGVDVIVQSCDKNFMVPVGGAIVVARGDVLGRITASYAGRASISSVLDLFVTLLSMGVKGYGRLLAEREKMFFYLKDQLRQLEHQGLIALLDTPHNDISLAVQVCTADPALGSRLFLRGVSGARLVRRSAARCIDGHDSLTDFGMHHDGYPWEHYLTVAAAIGQTKREIDVFIDRLVRLLTK